MTDMKETARTLRMKARDVSHGEFVYSDAGLEQVICTALLTVQAEALAEAHVLRDALAFYADRNTWRGEYPNAPIHKDCDGDFVACSGLRARTALSASPVPKR